jgi:hypothetical protein
MNVLTYKSFMDPHLLGNNHKIIGIKGCHYFKFQLLDNTPIMQYKASTDKGGKKYWHPMITYWENILKDLVMPFMINEHSCNKF